MRYEKLKIVDLIIRLQFKEFEEHYNIISTRPNVVWVSAVVQCPMKWVFLKKYPEISKADIKGYYVLGKAVHYGIQWLLQNYPHDLGFDFVEVEQNVEKIVDLDTDTKIVLSGRVDAIGYRDHSEYLEKTVIEIKTARSDIGIPHQHHVDQLRIYMNMVNAQRGILLYITPDRITEFEIENPMSDEELLELLENFMELKSPRFDWECQYCIYSGFCPKKIARR